LGIIPLAAGVVTELRTSAKNSVRELIDYTMYMLRGWEFQGLISEDWVGTRGNSQKFDRDVEGMDEIYYFKAVNKN